MKPVFKCDYCSYMNTEEEVRKHELECTDNYDRKSCYTCEHKNIKSKDGQWIYECKADKDVPEGMFYEFCSSYKRKEKSNNLFDGLFRGVFG